MGWDNQGLDAEKGNKKAGSHRLPADILFFEEAKILVAPEVVLKLHELVAAEVGLFEGPDTTSRNVDDIA